MHDDGYTNKNRMNTVGVIIMSSCANCGQGGGGELQSKNVYDMLNGKVLQCCMSKSTSSLALCTKRSVGATCCRITPRGRGSMFKPPPKNEECPICFLTLPSLDTHRGENYKTCCGKIICLGCIYADVVERIEKMPCVHSADLSLSIKARRSFCKDTLNV